MEFWIINDGGRAAAGFKGDAGDCVTRAFTIGQYGIAPTGEEYMTVYGELGRLLKEWAFSGRNSRAKAPYRNGRSATPRDGMPKAVIHSYATLIGWVWQPVMEIGKGTTMHLHPDELPQHPVMVVSLSKHLAAVVDGKLYDNHDASISRHSGPGKRAVYGYWVPAWRL